MKKTVLVTITLVCLCCGKAKARGELSAEYLSASELKDKDGNAHGKGDMLKVTGQYTLPLSVKRDEEGKVKAWPAMVRGMYATMNNRNGAEQLNPDNILNVSFNLSHIRPIGRRWRFIASIGAGVYSDPSEIHGAAYWPTER